MLVNFSMFRFSITRRYLEILSKCYSLREFVGCSIAMYTICWWKMNSWRNWVIQKRFFEMALYLKGFSFFFLWILPVSYWSVFCIRQCKKNSLLVSHIFFFRHSVGGKKRLCTGLSLKGNMIQTPYLIFKEN